MTGPCPMSEPTCGAATFLRPGGPVQVPFRPCCAAALLHAGRAPESPPPACPRRDELLGTDVPGGPQFALTFVPGAVHGCEVIP
jgi:hypothetical protein